MKIYIESLGCFKNNADTEILINKLSQHNCIFVDDPNRSDIIIINTCGFIKPAVEESIERILKLSQYKKNGKKLIAFGCMIERYKENIKTLIPELDFTKGVNSIDDIIKYLDENNKDTVHHTSKNKQQYIFTTLPYYSYIKIADGCNNNCSYCTIPSIKGKLKSLKMEDIKERVKNLIEKGVKEINLIAQDITKYGTDLYKEYKLCTLLENISKIKGNFYIRLLYLNPDGIDNSLIDIINNSEKIIKYLDIPIQHASDTILKKMNRKISSKNLFNLFDKIRSQIPEIFLRTTAIVGFPGESEEDFEKLLQFFDTFKPEWAGFFKYFNEEGTSASKLKEKINKKIVNERLNIIKSKQMKNTEEIFKKYIGKSIKVFVEKEIKKINYSEVTYKYIGRSLPQAPEIDGKCYISLDNNSIAINEFGPYNAIINGFRYPDIFVKIS
jgi:ribosomal protein S12 methylthiotransferase